MSIFFTSDLHFGHRSILKLGNGRPFATVEEHDQQLIANWNKVVKPGDSVYVLGDVSLRGYPQYMRECVKQLNGSKHLILGNHDRAKEHTILLESNVWQSMRIYNTLKVNYNDKKVRIVMSHCPILEFDGAYRKDNFHLYGHIHERNRYEELYQRLHFPAVHIGVDTSHTFPNTSAFSPIKLEDVITKVNNLFNLEI